MIADQVHFANNRVERPERQGYRTSELFELFDVPRGVRTGGYVRTDPSGIETIVQCLETQDKSAHIRVDPGHGLTSDRKGVGPIGWLTYVGTERDQVGPDLLVFTRQIAIEKGTRFWLRQATRRTRHPLLGVFAKRWIGLSQDSWRNPFGVQYPLLGDGMAVPGPSEFAIAVNHRGAVAAMQQKAIVSMDLGRAIGQDDGVLEGPPGSAGAGNVPKRSQ